MRGEESHEARLAAISSARLAQLFGGFHGGVVKRKGTHIEEEKPLWTAKAAQLEGRW